MKRLRAPRARERGRREVVQAGVVALAAALVAAGCDSPTIPGRDQPYEFTLTTTPALVFHWPLGSSIRVWVDEAADGRQGQLTDAVAHGMTAWNRAVLYDEYRLVAATSPAAADAIVVWSDDRDLPVATADCPPEVGRAVTTFCALEEETLRQLRPFPLSADPAARSPVRFLVTLGSREAEDPEVLRRLVAHELGHVLGIFRHSPSSNDLMWGGVLSTAVPSRADRQTVQILYHTAPDLRP